MPLIRRPSSRPASPPRPWVIGLDIGHSAGYAILTPAGALHDYGSLRWRHHREDGAGICFLRCEQAVAGLIRAVQEVSEDGVPIVMSWERVPRHNSARASQVYGGYVAIASKVCAEAEVPCDPVLAQEAAIACTGKPRPGKENVAVAVAHGFGLNETPKDENVTDAIAIAFTAWTRWNLDRPKTWAIRTG